MSTSLPPASSATAGSAPPSPWIVAGEGNANIVMFYTGDDPNLVGLALRVGKDNDSDEGHGGATAQPDAERKVEEAIWGDILPSAQQIQQSCTGPHPLKHASAVRQVLFMERVLRPLLGKEHAQAGVPVKLPAAAAAALCQSGVHMEEGRPATLLHNNTSIISASLPEGLRRTGSVVCLELKPKWGFLPSSPFLPQPEALRARLKTRVPRFTMHQLLKREQRRAKEAGGKLGAGGQQGPGDAEGLSMYNPLDLYSEEPQRMRQALKALIQVPGNNLRLFLDGSLAVGGRPDADSNSNAYRQQGKGQGQGQASAPAPSGWELLSSGLGLSAPAAEAEGGGGGGATEQAQDELVDLVCGALKQQGVMSRIRAVQQLDKCDVEGALVLYGRLVSELEGHGGRPSAVPLSRLVPGKKAKRTAEDMDAPAGSAPKELSGSCSVVGAGLAAAELPGSPLAPLLSWPQAQLEAELRDFLASATLKDCGVMVSLQRLEPEGVAAGAAGPPGGVRAAAEAAGFTGAGDAAPLRVGGNELEVLELQGGAAEGAAAAAPGTSSVQELPEVEVAASNLHRSPPRILLVREAGQAPSAERAYLFKISIVDLDPKSASKIPVHYELDLQVAECAGRHLDLLRTLGYSL